MHRTINHPVHGPRPVHRLLDHGHGVHLCSRLRFRFDHFHRVDDLTHRFDCLDGLSRLGFTTVDHRHLPNRAAGLREHRGSGFQDSHQQVEVKGAREVNHPVGLGIGDESRDPDLVPGLAGALWYIDGP